jgi:hypothetical protein
MIRNAWLFLLFVPALEGCTIDIWPSGPTEKPSTPAKPAGPVTVYGYPGYQYAYRTRATDPDGDKLVYQFNINGLVFPADDIWSAYYPSGDEIVYYTDFAGYGYSAQVRARVKDMQGNISPWSAPLPVQIQFFALPDTATIRPRISTPSSHFGPPTLSRAPGNEH